MMTRRRRRSTVVQVGPRPVTHAVAECRVAYSAVKDMVTRLLYRSAVQDAVIVFLAAISGGLAQPVASFAQQPWMYWAIVTGCCAALLVRSRIPRACLAILAIMMLLHQVVLHRPSAFAATICIIAAYTTQTCLAEPWRSSYLALIYGGTTGAILSSTDAFPGPLWPNRAGIAVAASAPITIAALAGSIRRRNHARTELAIERAAFLERHHEMTQRLAAAQERTQIAREMHDILGHSLTAIAVQAEGARYMIRTDTDRAERALADIGRLSRGAVDEVHELITVLRTENGHARKQPVQTLDDLGTVVDSLRHCGATVRLHCEGQLSAVPLHVSVAAYRIVQEALTNAIKHAGPAPVTIRVSVHDRQVRLLIVNSHRGSPTRLPERSNGHGTTGMRERVKALGGRIDIGPDPTTASWRVCAALPWGAP